MKKIILFHAAIIAGALSSGQVNADHSVKTSSLPSAVVCPSGYILVDQYTLPDGTTVVPQFCVMKYEAKQGTVVANARAIGGSTGALPVSVPAGTHWVNLTWQDARSACALSGAQLIKENQWLSIAHQVTSVASNWTSGVVGSGALFSGHNDNRPRAALAADPNEFDGYYGTGNSAPSNQRRTLTLPNGNVIWDLAGNVLEYTDATITVAAANKLAQTGSFTSYTSSSLNALSNNMKPKLSWNELNGMGMYLGYTSAYNNVAESPDNCTGFCGTNPTAAFVRGGRWYDFVVAGVFALNLDYGRSTVVGVVGFRCTS